MRTVTSSAAALADRDFTPPVMVNFPEAVQSRAVPYAQLRHYTNNPLGSIYFQNTSPGEVLCCLTVGLHCRGKVLGSVIFSSDYPL